MTRVDVISFPYMHDRDDRWYFGMPGKFLRVLDLKLGNDHGELLLTVESEQHSLVFAKWESFPLSTRIARQFYLRRATAPSNPAPDEVYAGTLRDAGKVYVFFVG